MKNEEFLISILEYNVSRDYRDRITYLVTNTQIQKNGEEIKEDLTNKISKIKNILNSKASEIEKISNSLQYNFKGGRQKRIHIEFNEKKYHIIGNTNNEEAVKLYNKIKEEKKKIIDGVY